MRGQVGAWPRRGAGRPVTNRGELVGEVRAAGVGGVEVRLNDQSQTAAHDAVAVLAAQRGLHARDALVRHTLHEADVEANLVPLNHSPFNLKEGQADARLCAAHRITGSVRVRGIRV